MTSAGTPSFREGWFHAQDGLRLYYRDYGDPMSEALPLVCLSGLTRNAKDFERFASRLAPQRRVICPDYRGRGRSAHDPDWRNYRPQVYLRDLQHLMTAANLQHVILCGTSLGGLLAMGQAVLAPTVLKGVIINDVGLEIHEAGLAHIRGYVGQPLHPKDWDEAVATVKRIYALANYPHEADWQALAHGTFREDATGVLVPDYDLAVAKSLSGPIPDLTPYFRALSGIPTLALRGETSQILTAESFERMAREKPDLVRVTVPGVGHPPSLEEPESRTAIDDFLARLDQHDRDARPAADL